MAGTVILTKNDPPRCADLTGSVAGSAHASTEADAMGNDHPWDAVPMGSVGGSVAANLRLLYT